LICDVFSITVVLCVCIRESCAFGAAGAAALSQLAHPYVAYGVYQHSYTKDNILIRFHKTFEYVFLITYGDAKRAIKASKSVRSIHNTIKGTIEENAGPFKVRIL
jgi:uncharacterized protein (DUF2236 family)